MKLPFIPSDSLFWIFKSLLSAILAYPLFFSCANPVKEMVVQQQVIPGELADPTMIDVNGVFYASGSSNDWGPFYPIYQSNDLKNWSFVEYVFPEKPEWAINSFWAPELFYRDGTFYCYYTARRKDGVSCIGVASTRDLKQGFQDHGVLIEWGNEAIDAFVYEEGEELYITWKAYGLTEGKPIQLLGSKLSKDGLSLEGESFEVMTAESDSWEKGGIEGQTILEHEGYLYMLYSGNACCGANCDYQVGVARAKTMTGPWEKHVGNPILKGNDQWKCPGHGTALKSGEDWFYLYHAYPSDGFPNLGRSALLSQLQWDEQSGWPYFSANSQTGKVDILSTDFSDDFQGNELHENWRFDVGVDNVEVNQEGGKLQLSAATQANSPAFLGINPEKADAEFQTVIEGENEVLKSLTFYVTRDNSLGLGVRGDSLVLWKLQKGELLILDKLAIDSGEKVYLKASMKGGKNFDFSYSMDRQNWNAISQTLIGDNLAWWSWGMKAGLSVWSEENVGEREGSFESFSVKY